MNFFEYLNRLNYNVLRKGIFRREVESSFFYSRKFALPKVHNITAENIFTFKTNYPFNFIEDEKEIPDAAAALRQIENESDIISEAEKIIANKFNILNSGEIFPGDDINWHYDYKAGFKWHEILVWKDNFFRFPKGADIKFPWELARFHFGILLGKAYLLTKDEKYTDKFLSLFQSFIGQNSFCVGVNWAASNEVSIRLVNICYAFSFFIFSPKVNENILNKFTEFILYHSVYIENNLLYNKNRGHEYLSNLLGLAAAGLLFKDFPYGNKNLQFTFSGFEKEIRTQVNPDGTSYEQSLPFHSFTLEHFYLGKILLEKAGIKLSKTFNERLHKMFLAQNVYLRDDNSIPQIGDAISSRLIPFNISDSIVNYHYTLPAGKFLFKETMITAKQNAEILFLFGIKAADEFRFIETEADRNNSIAYQNGGHFILRNKGLHLFISAGEIGKGGEGAPGHNDTFSFELFYKSKKFIVDSGTYSYYADPELRNYLRSVRAHNTFYIDGEQLAEFDGLFKIKEDLTKPKIQQWETNNLEDIFSVQHYAYTRLADPVISKRTFHYLKEKNIITIKDEFIGGANHEVVFNFHFHPEVTIEKISRTELIAINSGTKIFLNFTSSSPNFVVNIFDTKYSSAYGKLEPSKKINVLLKDKFPASLNTEISLK